MKSLKTILIEAITTRTQNLEDIEAICHLNNFKFGTAERVLRLLMADKVVKGIRTSKGAIIQYALVVEDLNEALRALIKATPVSFENRDKLAELGGALTSNNKYFVESVIKKYGILNEPMAN